MSLSTELNLQDYWRILRRRKWLLFITWFLVVIATWIFTEWQTPVYQAMAVVRIEAAPAIPGMASNQAEQNLINNELKTIKNSTVVEEAGRLLGRITDTTSK